MLVPLQSQMTATIPRCDFGIAVRRTCAVRLSLSSLLFVQGLGFWAGPKPKAPSPLQVRVAWFGDPRHETRFRSTKKYKINKPLQTKPAAPKDSESSGPNHSPKPLNPKPSTPEKP